MQGPHILIVDDDFFVNDSLCTLLIDEGYRASSAENGLKALEFLTSTGELPCLIILDLMMPEMDGFEFRKEQLRIPRLAGIPVVVLSAGRSNGKVEEMSIEAYLEKPIDLDRFFTVIRTYCGPGEQSLTH